MQKLILLFLLTLPITWAQKGEDLVHITFSQSTLDDKNYFIIKFSPKEGWHYYWKNAGDSGIPTVWNFSTKNQSMTLNMQEWPAPTLFKEAGELWTFGYNTDQLFFAEINQTHNKPDTLSFNTDYLICKDICIPGRQTFDFDIEDGKILIPETMQLSESKSELNLALKSLPQTQAWDSSWKWTLYRHKDHNELRLFYQTSAGQKPKADAGLLSPFLALPFNFRHENLYSKDNAIVGIIDIDWDGMYQEPKVDLPADDKFPQKYKLSFVQALDNSPPKVVNLDIQDFKTLATTEWEQLNKGLTPYQATATVTQAENVLTPSLWYILFFAFLGGLILNFMPCVLPIITLKLYNLIHHQQKQRLELWKHNGSYTAGTILCFWLIAAVIIGMRASGQSLGWGFQLQSPTFVWSLVLLFFIMALNLFGMFELQTPGSRWIHQLRSHHPYLDDLLAGLLAVIVATPCSAPFLGTALTFAFSSSNLEIFCIFTFMALGLSTPFLLTALFPKALNIFPKPGAWMNTFKYLMGFALLVTAIWLLEVLQNLIDFPYISFSIYTTLTLIFFTLFLWKKTAKDKVLLNFFILFTLFNVYRSFVHVAQSSASELSDTAVVEQGWYPWDPALLEQWGKSNEKIFVDATAKWCITCQVNKKLVFDTKEFKQWSQKNKIKLMRLDWTKRDPQIALWLQQHGAVSVPAYFTGHGSNLTFIGETISMGKLENAFEQFKP